MVPTTLIFERFRNLEIANTILCHSVSVNFALSHCLRINHGIPVRLKLIHNIPYVAVSCNLGSVLNNPQIEQSTITFSDAYQSICDGTELFDDGARRNNVKCTAVGEYGILSKPVSGCSSKNHFQSSG